MHRWRIAPARFCLLFVYPLLPWIGVMLLGFGVAGLFELPPARRNAVLLRAGLAMTAGFVVLRAFDVYGDPNPWQRQPAGLTATAIDFLNTTKYPPSLVFMLMTLGPAAIVCAFADRFVGRRERRARDVRSGAVRVLCGPLLPDPRAERAVWASSRASTRVSS